MNFISMIKLSYVAPRQLFRWLEEEEDDRYTNLLLWIAGASWAISGTHMADASGSAWWGQLLVNMLSGAIFGWIGYYIFCSVVRLCGSWLGGQADTRAVLRMYAHATIVTLPALLIVGFILYTYGPKGFEIDVRSWQSDWNAHLLNRLLNIALIIFSLWAFGQFVIGLAQAQKFSVWKALLSILLPVFTLLTICWALFFAASRLTPA